MHLILLRGSTKFRSLQVFGERGNVGGDVRLRGHDFRRALGTIAWWIVGAQDARFEQLTRGALHRRPDRPRLRGIRRVALGALREIDLAAALGERALRCCIRAAGGGEGDNGEQRERRRGETSGGKNHRRPASYVPAAGLSKRGVAKRGARKAR